MRMGVIVVGAVRPGEGRGASIRGISRVGAKLQAVGDDPQPSANGPQIVGITPPHLLRFPSAFASSTQKGSSS